MVTVFGLDVFEVIVVVCLSAVSCPCPLFDDDMSQIQISRRLQDVSALIKSLSKDNNTIVSWVKQRQQSASSTFC